MRRLDNLYKDKAVSTSRQAVGERKGTVSTIILRPELKRGMSRRRGYQVKLLPWANIRISKAGQRRHVGRKRRYLGLWRSNRSASLRPNGTLQSPHLMSLAEACCNVKYICTSDY